MKSRLTKNIFISIAVVLMLFLSAFFVLKHFQSRMTKSSISSGGESETGKPETLPVEVKVVTVTSSAENIMLESQGKVMPSRTFSIPALSEGKVTRVYFNKGDFVGKGAALAVISNPDVNSDISSLNSKISINQTSIGILRRKIQESDSKKRLNQEQIKEDEAKLKDYREMLTLGLVTKNDLRNVKNGLRALQIESRNIDIEAQGIKNDIETKKSENQDSLMLLSKLKLRMENFRVSSPYSGYLIDIAPEGSFANYGQSLAAIASTGYEYVEALIPADQAEG
ncbi:MAG: efflux RND transporter periplasmic adaptor subunit [Firmicutes bacterium]|nr:efflux RND transporter periplasmic adaptor subunit [Bacillota bacterium]